MLQNAPFYWGSIRKLVECFGVVFADIHIERRKADGTLAQTIAVPLSYGPKEKWVVRNKQNPMPGTDDSVEMVLPRMTYEIAGGRYDTARKLTSTGRHVQALTNDNTVLKTQFNPVPYNFTFVLHIMTKTVEDGLMIIEQIIPFFTPDYTISVNDMPELKLEKDIVILYDGNITQEDTWDGNLDQRRMITWTLNFTVKGYLYPPVKLTKVNLRTNVQYLIDNGVNAPGDLVPGYSTIPSPPDANAANVTQASNIYSDQVVVVTAGPSAVTLSGGQSQVFSVIVVNAPNMAFVAVPQTTDQTGADTYSTDTVQNTFTYTAGVGERTTPETITVTFVSNADPAKSATVTLNLNP